MFCMCQILAKMSYLQGPLIPANVAVENDRLPSDDDITPSNRETEQNDVTSDENIVSEGDSDDD